MTENNKLEALRDTITKRGDVEYERLLSEAKTEIEAWVSAQEAEIEKNSASALVGVKKQVAEDSERQIANAKSEAERERLKLLSDCVSRAKSIFENKLNALAGHKNYPDILTGLAVEAIDAIPKENGLILRLSNDDSKYFEAVINGIKKKFPSREVVFDSAPADIVGGVVVSTDDGRWKVVSDWKAKVEELADTIAARVLSAL